MAEDILKELDAEGLRAVFLEYTRKAFDSIPEIDKPRILDIGCGTGTVTLELARLSNGEITSIDIDKKSLDKLNHRIREKGLSDKVKVYNRSVYNTKFEDEMFDIIWEEGVIHLLDFKKAMTECNRILKINGYLISGETNNWVDKKLKHFPKYGFKIFKKIPWGEQCWWKEYYAPLEKRINDLRRKYDNIDGIKEISHQLTEIEMVKKNTRGFECTTYILQKIK
jgi:ubiquinone/menaquinone biosynthesis C-methylase UbiE